MSAEPAKKNRLPKVPHDPPSKYFAGVGEIVLRVGRLEYQLGAMARVATKLGKDDQRRLFYPLRGTRLCETLEMLAGFMDDRQKASALQALAQDAARLIDRRDNYVHSVYGCWPDSPEIPMRFRLRKHKPGQEIISQRMTVDELVKLASELKAIEARAQALHTRLKPQ